MIFEIFSDKKGHWKRISPDPLIKVNQTFNYATLHNTSPASNLNDVIKHQTPKKKSVEHNEKKEQVNGHENYQ